MTALKRNYVSDHQPYSFRFSGRQNVRISIRTPSTIFNQPNHWDFLPISGYPLTSMDITRLTCPFLIDFIWDRFR